MKLFLYDSYSSKFLSLQQSASPATEEKGDEEEEEEGGMKNYLCFSSSLDMGLTVTNFSVRGCYKNLLLVTMLENVILLEWLV